MKGILYVHMPLLDSLATIDLHLANEMAVRL